ncbi:MAG: aminomethyltransferase beta-barrel domain-containing protein, partial [bacterium]
LSRALLPLGDLTKQQTRDKARALGLKTADKKESMEICFVPNDDYGQFLAKTGLGRSLPGEITDREGKVLGKHEGIEFFTIGQRRGLKLSQPTPLYVVDLDPAQNRVVVGNPRDLECDELTVERCNWIALENLEGPTEVLAKIRYNHPGASATIRPLGRDRARVKFAIPQRAIAPGQACVFYQDDLVLGGGWIVKEPLPEA